MGEKIFKIAFLRYNNVSGYEALNLAKVKLDLPATAAILGECDYGNNKMYKKKKLENAVSKVDIDKRALYVVIKTTCRIKRE